MGLFAGPWLLLQWPEDKEAPAGLGRPGGTSRVSGAGGTPGFPESRCAPGTAPPTRAQGFGQAGPERLPRHRRRRLPPAVSPAAAAAAPPAAPRDPQEETS